MVDVGILKDLDRYLKENYKGPDKNWPARWWEPGSEESPEALPEDQWLDIEPEDLPFE